MPRQHKGDRKQLHTQVAAAEKRWAVAEAKRHNLFLGEFLSNLIHDARMAQQAERKAKRAKREPQLGDVIRSCGWTLLLASRFENGTFHGRYLNKPDGWKGSDGCVVGPDGAPNGPGDVQLLATGQPLDLQRWPAE